MPYIFAYRLQYIFEHYVNGFWITHDMWVERLLWLVTLIRVLCVPIVPHATNLSIISRSFTFILVIRELGFFSSSLNSTTFIKWNKANVVRIHSTNVEIHRKIGKLLVWLCFSLSAQRVLQPSRLTFCVCCRRRHRKLKFHSPNYCARDRILFIFFWIRENWRKKKPYCWVST